MTLFRFAAYTLFAAQLLTLVSYTDADDLDFNLPSQYLRANEYLLGGASIRYHIFWRGFWAMTMEDNCNFVFSDNYGVNYWDSETADVGTPRECYVIMQDDCDLAIYPDSNSGPGYGSPALWHTNTASMGANCYLWIGYFADSIKGGVFDDKGTALWTTHNQ